MDEVSNNNLADIIASILHNPASKPNIDMRDASGPPLSLHIDSMHIITIDTVYIAAPAAAGTSSVERGTKS